MFQFNYKFFSFFSVFSDLLPNTQNKSTFFFFYYKTCIMHHKPDLIVDRRSVPPSNDQFSPLTMFGNHVSSRHVT